MEREWKQAGDLEDEQAGFCVRNGLPHQGRQDQGRQGKRRQGNRKANTDAGMRSGTCEAAEEVSGWLPQEVTMHGKERETTMSRSCRVYAAGTEP